MLDEDDIAAHEKRMARKGGGIEIGLSKGVQRN